MADPIERLEHALLRLPGVGKKSAQRLAYFVLSEKHDYANALAQAVVNARAETRICGICGHLSTQDPCRFCSDPRRTNGVLCVVEQVPDLLAIEASGAFLGRYHVLGGSLSPLNGIGPDDLNLSALLARVETERPSEVIVATNPTVDGEATALYLNKLLRPKGVNLTRLASGLPVGADLEFLDGETISRAFKGRREIS